MRLVAIAALFLTAFSSCDLLDDTGNMNPDTPTPKPTPRTDDPITPTPTGSLKDFYPTQAKGDVLVEHQYYSISYSKKYKNPEWAIYELTSSRVSKDATDRRSGFLKDPKNEYAANDKDFDGAGYDRGHLVPAEDMNFSEKAMEESFFMSNVSPQAKELNRGRWKSLETKVREWATEYKNIYIVAGAILPKRRPQETWIGENADVFVPRKFYKIILDPKGKKGIAFMFDNKECEKELVEYATTIQKIEEETEINFFPKLSASEKKQLEETIDVTKWTGLE